VPRYGVEDSFIRSACEALANDVRCGSPMGTMYGESLIAALSAHLLRHHSASLPSGGDPIGARRSMIVEYIHDRMSEPLSLAELAALSQLDVFSFSRWFKATFGVPPYRYVLRVRLESAKAMLRDTSKSVVEVALNCGFSNHSHFTACFRRASGLTPTAYRAAFMGNPPGARPRRGTSDPV
jgi:AraC family transcriptional regulator